MLNACAINKVLLMGRLIADPELRQTQSGIYTCRFVVAVNRPTSKDNSEQQSDFIPCVAWREQAEFLSKYFSKGRLVLVEGNLRTGSYDDRNHPDVRHYTTDVMVERVSFGETKSSAGNGQGNNPPPQSTYQAAPPQQAANGYNLNDFTEVISDSDLPF